MSRSAVAVLTVGFVALVLTVTIVPVQPQRDRRTGSIGWWPCPSRQQLRPADLEDDGRPEWVSLTTMCGGWGFPYRNETGNWVHRFRLRPDLWATQIVVVAGAVVIGLLATTLVRRRHRWRGTLREAPPPRLASLGVTLLGLTALSGTLLAVPVTLHSGLFQPPAESMDRATLWPFGGVELLPAWLAVGRHDGGPMLEGQHLAWAFQVETARWHAVQLPVLLGFGAALTWAIRRHRRLRAYATL